MLLINPYQTYNQLTLSEKIKLWIKVNILKCTILDEMIYQRFKDMRFKSKTLIEVSEWSIKLELKESNDFFIEKITIDDIILRVTIISKSDLQYIKLRML